MTMDLISLVSASFDVLCVFLRVWLHESTDFDRAGMPAERLVHSKTGVRLTFLLTPF